MDAYSKTAAVLLAAALVGVPTAAKTLIYGISGSGEARISGFAYDYGSGAYVDSPYSTLFGEAAFTASYRLDVGQLPVNNPPSGGTFDYSSYGGAPTFLTSQTSAVVAGQQFGLTSFGTIYSRVSDPYAPGSGYILVDAVVANDYANPIRTYYESGAVKSETTFDGYNQFYSFTGGTTIVDGVALPDFANGGSIQAIYTIAVQQFSEDGSRGIYSYVSRGFTGNGYVELSIAGAAVPEPGAWALMIAGFGIVGGSLRKRRARLASGHDDRAKVDVRMIAARQPLSL